MVMKKVTIITNRGANEEEQAKAAALAFSEFMKQDEMDAVKEICDQFGIPNMLLSSDQTFNINAQQIIKTEDADFEIIQPKQLPPAE